jgi:hypothetical protein
VTEAFPHRECLGGHQPTKHQNFTFHSTVHAATGAFSPAGHPPIAGDVAEALAQLGLPGEVPAPQLPADPAATEGCADIVYLSDLPLRLVEWLWQDRLASGALAMISGESGSGKTWPFRRRSSNPSVHAVDSSSKHHESVTEASATNCISKCGLHELNP